MVRIVNKIFSERTLILLFAVLLAIPIFTSSFDSGQVTRTELRQPEGLPEFPDSFEALQSIPGKLDAFFNDHFGLRSDLIRLNNRLKSQFHVSGSPEILIGKDDWLYLAKNHNVLNQFRGFDRFSNQSLSNWIDAIKWRADWLTHRQIPFFLVIAPNKHSIYPEFLPDYLIPVAYTRLDQLSSSLNDGSDFEFIDLRSTLQKAKTKQRVYHKTDSHWNQFGSFNAYLAVMARIQKYFSEIKHLSISEFELKIQNEQGGDLARMLNLQNYYRENSLQLHFKNPSRIIRKSLLRINNWRSWRTIADVDNHLKVLIIGDSFFVNSKNGMESYLCETFSETILIRDRSLRFDPKLVELFKPDIVIHAVVERRLDLMPRNLSSSKSKFTATRNNAS